MNSFVKLENNDWAVRVGFGPMVERGHTVTVTLRNGGTKQVTLGDFVREDQYGRIFKIVPAAPRATETVGDLSGIVALFDRARQHLRHPAIVLDGFRVNVAGQRAREPGSLTVTSVERSNYRTRFGGGDTRQYFGRVTRAGVYEPARGAPEGIAPRLRAFALDPAGEAARHGRLHGICCFCNRALTDERSTAVGYGPICADHFGLPWGSRAASTANSPAASDGARFVEPEEMSVSNERVEAARRIERSRIERIAATNRQRSIASEEAMEREAMMIEGMQR